MSVTVQSLGQRQYAVRFDGCEVHYVNLHDPSDAAPPCDCEDHLWRNNFNCKHLKAVKRYEERR